MFNGLRMDDSIHGNNNYYNYEVESTGYKECTKYVEKQKRYFYMNLKALWQARYVQNRLYEFLVM